MVDFICSKPSTSAVVFTHQCSKVGSGVSISSIDSWREGDRELNEYILAIAMQTKTNSQRVEYPLAL
jgi:hypothetical protein